MIIGKAINLRTPKTRRDAFGGAQQHRPFDPHNMNNAMDRRKQLRHHPVVFAAILAFFLCPAACLASNATSDELIEINLPPDVELSVLADYVGHRLGINIIYDNSIKNKRITIVSPEKIPLSALLGLLESTLKASGLMLSDTDYDGWRIIVTDKEMVNETSTLRQEFEGLDDISPSYAVTQIIPLQYLSPDEAQKMVKLLLSKSGGSCFTIENRDLLVVTDRRSRIQMIIQLLELADHPLPESTIEFVKVTHSDAEILSNQVSALLTQKSKVAGEQDSPSVVLQADKRSNQIMVVALSNAATEAIELIHKLDVPDYSPPSPVRFYKLINTTASEVLATIKSLAITDNLAQIVVADELLAVTGSTGPESTNPVMEDGKNDHPEPTQGPVHPARPTSRPGSRNKSTAQRETPKTSVTADTNTNSIIVIGPPAMQAVYEKLILMLDKRRPQVMIEVTMVSMDTSGNYSFGVELGGFNVNSDKRQLIFSSFGLSEIDQAQGLLELTPGLGFNGTLIDIGDYSAVMRALETNGNARVLSSPKVLVNDNATAKFSSVSEAPYTSVNASDTVATTSFAGYAEAGTQVTVTPHISEGDHLQLQYSVSLNSFSGEGTSDIPPPRQTNEINSEVTIPDGHAIIIGGLKRSDQSETSSSIPLLGKIPLLKHLFGNRTNTQSESTLFVFIRPVILRDDQFEDLKHLSDMSLNDAQVNVPRQIGDLEISAGNSMVVNQHNSPLGRIMLME